MIVNKKFAFVLWLTGYSGAGKTTLAYMLKEKLESSNLLCAVLDGDILRSGLNNDLSFSKQDRKENIRRIIETAKILNNLGIIVIVATISPFEEDRLIARTSFVSGTFFLCYVKCPLYVCKQRDAKGLYKKVNQGLIKEFTGIDSTYEEPSFVDLYVETDKTSQNECEHIILKYLEPVLVSFKNIHE